MSVTAVIIIRKGSRRLPNKNYQLINGESLFERKIKQLKQTKGVDRVVLGSDDKDIKDKVLSLGAEFYLREEKYCDEKSTTVNDVVKNMLSFIETDTIIWAHSTNPLITSHHYEESLDQYFATKEIGYDSIFSVNELEGHFWTDRHIPLNFSPMSPIHTVAKDLPKIYAQNGGIFIRNHKDMKEDGAFLGKRPFMYIMDKYEGWDIDYPADLKIAKVLAEGN